MIPLDSIQPATVAVCGIAVASLAAGSIAAAWAVIDFAAWLVRQHRQERQRAEMRRAVEFAESVRGQR